jgi:hypothetical protein
MGVVAMVRSHRHQRESGHYGVLNAGNIRKIIRVVGGY